MDSLSASVWCGVLGHDVVVRLHTVDKGIQDELAVLLDEVVDVAENSTVG